MERIKLKQRPKPRIGNPNFVKGHKLTVGNAGNNRQVRRAKRYLTEGLRHILEEYPDPKKREKAWEKMLRDYVNLTKPGVAKASIRKDVVKDIFERIEGKPVQAIEITGKDGGHIKAIHAHMSMEEIAIAYKATLALPPPKEQDD